MPARSIHFAVMTNCDFAPTIIRIDTHLLLLKDYISEATAFFEHT